MQESLSVRKAFEGKNVLVTGATGFVGKVFLSMLLDEVENVGNVHVLVRGGKDKTATDRLTEMFSTSPAFRPLRAKHGSNLSAFLSAHIDVVDGDVSQPYLGLTKKAAEKLAKKVDLVIHIAGLTDFEPDPCQAIDINIRGGMNAADVAAMTPRGRLVHVSTCFVVGNRSGEITETVTPGIAPNGKKIDPETEITALLDAAKASELTSERKEPKWLKRARVAAGTKFANGLGYPNLYTLSKSLSEQMLATRTDIALSIARPAIVECAVSYPLPGWNEGVNTSAPLVWLLASPFRELPARPDVRFDVIPVDTCCRGLMLISAASLRNEAEQLYQMGTSQENPLTLGRAIDLTSLGARKHHMRDGATTLERFVLRYLDAVPVDADREGPLHVSRLRKLAKNLRSFVAEVDMKKVLPKPVHAALGERVTRAQWVTHMALQGADMNLRRVEYMLRLYRPFIHDNDWTFSTTSMKKLASRLTSEEKSTFGYDVTTIDWRSYWLDTQWPGLAKWCLPILEGEEIPNDPPMEPALRLRAKSTTKATTKDADEVEGAHP
ncbi:MAG: SDR family oxidoreductase [Sandaracinaceae bacterium]|nr:SDR family oxidoreductase [Sandaracinaceae bacterium]